MTPRWWHAVLLVLLISGGGCDKDPPVLAGGFAFPCRGNADCQTELCLPVGRCTKVCSSSAVCPSAPNWRCEKRPNSVDWCACEGGGDEVCDGKDNDCDGLVDNGATCPGGGQCRSGSCGCPPATTTCGSSCANLSSDPNHCSRCDFACTTTPPQAVATCVGGTCGWNCAAGRGNCDQNDSNGCETDTRSDPQNCGRCGRACSGCSGGECPMVKLVDEDNRMRDIAVGAGHVYWAGSDALEVRRVPIGGGAISTVAPGDSDGIVVAGQTVYWTDTVTGRVLSTAVGGGAPKVLASGQKSPQRLCVAGGFVYWANVSDRTIAKVPTSGGSVELVAKDQQTLGDIAADTTHVYWTDAGAIRRQPLGGGTTETISPKGAGAVALAVDSSHVYFSDPTAGAVRRVPKAGGAAETLASDPKPQGIAVDGKTIYWAAHTRHAIYALPKGGGSPAPIVSNEKFPTRLILDANNVYFSTLSGNLYQVPK